MKILISGSTGLVGTALIPILQKEGHQVSRLVRPQSSRTLNRSPDLPDVTWDPHAGALGASADGADVVVHLAGASIADGRWTVQRKRLLHDSRVEATRHLVKALGAFKTPPKHFIAASAIGFYGDRGDETLRESSGSGQGFLADLTRKWEAESLRAGDFGARVVVLRFGVILAGHGGALPRMVLPFRFGAGGRIGSGRQFMSWVALDDVVSIIRFVIANSRLSGPVNAVSPNPVHNADFARTLGVVLHRPALLPTPAFPLRLLLGEMAQELLLSSQCVVSAKLQAEGYQYVYPELRPALAHALRQSN